jgi:hypothetical protein
MKLKDLINGFLYIGLFLAISCVDYGNETIDWIDNIEKGTKIEIVKKNQPDFFEVDWENPMNVEDQQYYNVTNIKGSRDMLNMDYYLVFKDNRFTGRDSKK